MKNLRRITRALTAVFALTTLTLAPSTALAAVPTEPTTAVTSGSADWGVKESFRNYVKRGNGNPPIAATDGATINTDGTFHFSFTSGDHDPATGTAEVNYRGTVVFSYPLHQFTVTVQDPTVVVTATEAKLVATITSATGGAPGTPARVDFVTLTRTTPTVNGSTTTWTNVPATLTEAGAQAFAGFYTAGTAFDPLSFNVTA